MKLSLILACVPFAAYVSFAASYDSLYTAETGYVTMKGDDSTDNSGFAGKGKWSDGLPPHADTNYYVGTGRKFNTPNNSSLNGHVFQGNKLVVANQITHTVGSGVTISWGNTEFLPGSIYHFNSVGAIESGVFTVKGTEDSPFIFSVNRSNTTSREIIQKMDMVSDSLGYTVLQQYGNTRQTYTYLGDWTRYYGTLVCTTNLYIQLKPDFESPGKFVVPDGGVMACLSNNSTVVLGSLDVASGGKVCFKGSSEGTLFYVTNSLSLAAGAIVDTSNFFNRADSVIHTSMVFRLSPKVVEAGLPDWDKVVYPYRKKGVLGDLPNIVPFVMDDPEVEGGKYMGLRMKEIVYMTNTCSHYNSALDLELNKPEAFWSDGQWPAAGKDYVLASSFIAYGNENPYVFPGDSVTTRAVYFGMYKQMNDLTFDNLVFLGRTVFRPLEGACSYIVRGKLKLMANEDYPDSAFVAIYNRQDFNIASDISGSNNLHACPKRMGDDLLESPCGTVRLSGDNTAWTGKLLVAGTNDVYDTTKGLCELNALTNLTLRVTDSKNLGGTLPEFAYDALTVSNQCRLAIDGTTVFNETTRGWYFPRTAYLYVDGGKTATCLNTLTIGGELVKEGAGTLCIGAKPTVEGSAASITVQAGVLAAAVPDAFEGISVNLCDGASIGVDVNVQDEAFKSRGLELGDDTISAANGGKIAFSLIGVSGDLAEGCGPYALFTCAAEKMEELKNNIRVNNPWPGESVSVNYAEKVNGDGTVTLSVSFYHCGLRVIVR